MDSRGKLNLTAYAIAAPDGTSFVTIINQESGIYNGAFTGRILNGRASIKWSQPRNGSATGTGIIRMHNDNTFGGGMTFTPPGAVQPVYREWYGMKR